MSSRLTTALAALGIGLAILGTPSRAEGPATSVEVQYRDLTAGYAKARDALRAAMVEAQRLGPAERRRLLQADPRPDYARRFLRLAAEHPDDPHALLALSWVAETCLFEPQAEEAMDRVIAGHIADVRVGPLATQVGFLYGASFPPVERLLRAAMSRNPHPEVVGRACLALATYLRREVDDSDRKAALAEAGTGDVPGNLPPPARLGPGLSRAERAAKRQEAEGLYRRVIAEFPGLKVPHEDAEVGLFELRNLMIGRVGPEIVGVDMKGRPMRLSDFRGKVVVLHFWNHEVCPPCRGMYPAQKAFVRAMEGKPFAFLGVNDDGDRDVIRRVMEAEGLTWPTWWDGAEGPASGPIMRRWNVRGYPATYVLDESGVIRLKGNLQPHETEAMSRLLLDELAEAKKAP